MYGRIQLPYKGANQTGRGSSQEACAFIKGQYTVVA